MLKRIAAQGDDSGNHKSSSQNSHLSEEQLLLALDGELSSRDAVLVKVHLESCWSCRTRSEQIGEAIADFVEYRNFLITRYSSPPAGTRAVFVARLEQLAQSVGRPSLRSRIAGALGVLRGLLQYEVPRHVWISGVVIAALVILLLTRLPETPRISEVPRVSASQFLDNAQASEVRALQRVARPVVYQKLRIRVGSQDVTRTIYRDRAGNRRADKLDVSNSGGNNERSGRSPRQGPNGPNASQVEADLQRIFQRAGLNWQDPLSPATYRAWHNSLREKQDEVIQRTEEFITLKTTTVNGPITEASITARSADFHSVAEQLRLKDMRLVEISELDWEVIPLEAVNPAVFVVEAAPPPVVPRSTGPTDTELAESELQARLALHAERADLGEGIELDRDTLNIAGYHQQALIVRGVLESPERKAEISAALRGIPHLELQLQTVEEAQAIERQSAEHKPSNAATQTSAGSEFTRASGRQEPRENVGMSEDAISGKPLLNQKLEERYPNAAERTAFVNHAVQIAESALARAWALRRLRDRYTPEEVVRLGYGSRHILELLIRDNLSVLRQYVDEARTSFLPLLAPESSNAETPAPHTFESPLPSAEKTGGVEWRNDIAEIFPEVQRMHRSVPALFVQTTQPDSDAQILVRDLRSAIVQLETYVTLLDQHVTGSFLAETRRGGENKLLDFKEDHR